MGSISFGQPEPENGFFVATGQAEVGGCSQRTGPRRWVRVLGNQLPASGLT